MLKKVSGKRSNKKKVGLNLVPILDAVFIFIFFLLLSTEFVKFFSISGEIPLVAQGTPPKSKKIPLNLTIKIQNDGFYLLTGPTQTLRKKISSLGPNRLNYKALNQYLLRLKTQNPSEKTVTLDPVPKIDFNAIVKTMDAVRLTTQGGRIKPLFGEIVFGNINY